MDVGWLLVALCIAMSVAPTKTADQCPLLLRGFDYKGNDMGIPGCRNNTGTAEECCARCQETKGCVAWSWGAEYSTIFCPNHAYGGCWLKNATTSTGPQDVRTQLPNLVTGTMKPPQIVISDNQTNNGTNLPPWGKAGVCAAMKGYDFKGNDIVVGCNNPTWTAGDCCTSCSLNDACVAWSWTPYDVASHFCSNLQNKGACWLKNNKNAAGPQYEPNLPGIITGMKGYISKKSSGSSSNNNNNNKNFQTFQNPKVTSTNKSSNNGGTLNGNVRGSCKSGSQQSRNGARGRPSIKIVKSGKTFVSDIDTMLRAVRWSADMNGQLPPRSMVAGTKNLGMNTFHLYAEAFSAGQQPGYKMNMVDTIVKWTREEGLYCVITLGNLAKNGQFDYNWTMKFWKLYAPRYKDETHVMYELQNEPVAWSPGYPQNAIKMEIDGYNLIRSLAPNTPILLFSYAGLDNSNNVERDVAAVQAKTKVDWTNTAIAFHGYAGAKWTEQNIRGCQANGRPLICTEFKAGNMDGPGLQDTDATKVFEKYGVSWLSFVDLGEAYQGYRFQDRIDQAGISWKPDYGSWPTCGFWQS